MLKSAAYVAGWANAFAKLGAPLGGAQSLKLEQSVRQALGHSAEDAALHGVRAAGGSASSVEKGIGQLAPAGAAGHSAHSARHYAHPEPTPFVPPRTAAPAPDASPYGVNPAPKQPVPQPEIPAASPYGVNPAPRQPAAQPEIPAAQPAAAAAPAEGAGGPFAKLRNANLGPKAAIGLGLGAGGLYAANQLGQDPQMTVTPSAPYYTP